jgi:hypothetical protein
MWPIRLAWTTPRVWSTTTRAIPIGIIPPRFNRPRALVMFTIPARASAGSGGCIAGRGSVRSGPVSCAISRPRVWSKAQFSSLVSRRWSASGLASVTAPLPDCGSCLRNCPTPINRPNWTRVFTSPRANGQRLWIGFGAHQRVLVAWHSLRLYLGSRRAVRLASVTSLLNTCLAIAFAP